LKTHIIHHILCVVKGNHIFVIVLDLKKDARKQMYCKSRNKAEPEHLVPRGTNEDYSIVFNHPESKDAHVKPACQKHSWDFGSYEWNDEETMKSVESCSKKRSKKYFENMIFLISNIGNKMIGNSRNDLK
jgi:hypothetical protein